MARYIDAENWSYEGTTTKARYIDAEKIPYTDLNADMPQSKVRVYVAFKERVDRIPTADVRENIHGEWVVGVVPQYDRGQGTFCSRCGWAWSDHIDAIKLNPVLSLIKTNYCPNCGADMREVE